MPSAAITYRRATVPMPVDRRRRRGRRRTDDRLGSRARRGTSAPARRASSTSCVVERRAVARPRRTARSSGSGTSISRPDGERSQAASTSNHPSTVPGSRPSAFELAQRQRGESVAAALVARERRLVDHHHRSPGPAQLIAAAVPAGPAPTTSTSQVASGAVAAVRGYGWTRRRPWRLRLGRGAPGRTLRSPARDADGERGDVMNRLCEGRVAIVTGAGRGIGREHALSLARARRQGRGERPRRQRSTAAGAIVEPGRAGGRRRSAPSAAKRSPTARASPTSTARADDPGRDRRLRRPPRGGQQRRHPPRPDARQHDRGRVGRGDQRASQGHVRPGRTTRSRTGAIAPRPAIRSAVGSSTPRRCRASTATPARRTTAPPRPASPRSPRSRRSRRRATASRSTRSPRSRSPA